MSLPAKNLKSFRKKDVKESKALSNGFTKLVFAHKASAGDTGIDLGSLVIPPEMSVLGFVNPTPSRLLEARLFQFKDNLELTSSSKNTLIQSLSYRVASNSRIQFEGFTAEEGEIFTGVIDSNPISGIQVVDSKTPVADGDLTDGNIDFTIGFSTSAIRQEILVVRNGLIQKRNSNNSSTVLDGNYYVVDSGSGSGNVIRFNVAASGQDDSIIVTAIGGQIESPTNSTWDELEKVQGQIDALVPTVAELADVPETDFQAAPNNVDLKQFGDRVIALENDKQDKIQHKWQQKFLSGDVTFNTTLGDLTFNNLEIGKTYRVNLHAFMGDNQGSNSGITLSVVHDGNTLAAATHTSDDATGPSNSGYDVTTAPFVATATTVTFVSTGMGGTDTIFGTGDASETNAVLEELPNHVETTQWT